MISYVHLLTVTKWGQLISNFVPLSGIHPLKSFKDGSFEKEMLQIPGNYRSTAIDEWHLLGITEVYLIFLICFSHDACLILDII